jgi:hypothetical protein
MHFVCFMCVCVCVCVCVNGFETRSCYLYKLATSYWIEEILLPWPLWVAGIIGMHYLTPHEFWKLRFNGIWYGNVLEAALLSRFFSTPNEEEYISEKQIDLSQQAFLFQLVQYVLSTLPSASHRDFCKNKIEWLLCVWISEKHSSKIVLQIILTQFLLLLQCLKYSVWLCRVMTSGGKGCCVIIKT